MTDEQEEKVPRLKLYLSGPMRGCDQFDFSAFEEAAGQLREAGYEVISPHGVDLEGRSDLATAEIPKGKVLGQMLVWDAAAISECDGLALLPGWLPSGGATWELDMARMMGLTCQPVSDWCSASDAKVKEDWAEAIYHRILDELPYDSDNEIVADALMTYFKEDPSRCEPFVGTAIIESDYFENLR